MKLLIIYKKILKHSKGRKIGRDLFFIYYSFFLEYMENNNPYIRTCPRAIERSMGIDHRKVKYLFRAGEELFKFWKIIWGKNYKNKSQKRVLGIVLYTHYGEKFKDEKDCY